MAEDLRRFLSDRLADLRRSGLYKEERVLHSPQGAEISAAAAPGAGAPGGGDALEAAGAPAGGRPVLNFCANNYLGLANHPLLKQAAADALQRWGYGLASVRFICGTQEIHKRLERRLADFLGMEDAILFGSCFDANGGVFEALLGEQDAVISDELNHASIIDGVRLCKAKRLRYRNNDLADLEARLGEAEGARFKLIATDGVFSMDGSAADLAGIAALARARGALVLVDDSHGVGVLGARGAGTPEHCGLHGKIDVLTGTLGKALGGASGGYVAASREITSWLRQRARPYLFSNTLPPPLVAAAEAAVDLAENGAALRARLARNGERMRGGLKAAGYSLLPGTHPIIPVMIGEAAPAKHLADRLLGLGVYVIAFSFPVVPEGKARIRVQVSAAHDDAQVDRAVAAFASAGRELGVIP